MLTAALKQATRQAPSNKMSRRRPGRLSVGDIAGIANLVCAVLAIGISLYVFCQQSKSDLRNATVLQASRDALRTTTRLLSQEQGQLSKVSSDLGIADAALSRLEGHAAAQVNELKAAEHALKDSLATATAEYGVDNSILATSKSLFDISHKEQTERLTALKARPRLWISLEYLRSDKPPWESPRDTIARNKILVPPVGSEFKLYVSGFRA